METTRKYVRGWNKSRVFAIAFLVIAIAFADYLTGENGIGGVVIAARFIWGIIVIISAFAWETIVRISFFAMRRSDMIIGAILRSRLLHSIDALITVNIGYLSRAVLNDVWGQRFSDWRESLKMHTRRIRRWWKASPLWGKFVIVGMLIFAQIRFLPVWHEYVVLFPVGFMIHAVESIYRRIFGRVVNKAIDRVVGDKSEELVERIDWLERLRRRLGLWRLRWMTAWRLCRHHPRYLDEKTGERYKSVLEPARLMWRGGASLDRYVGKPLLAGYEGRPEMK